MIWENNLGDTKYYGQKKFYKHGNKSGRLLARTIQVAKVSSMIHYIRDKHGILHSKNEDIAKQFKTFYSTLYNLKQEQRNPVSPSSRTAQIRDFVAQFGPKPIS